MKPTLVLLAAGMGSRYGGLKQLDQLGPSGETIMDYSIYDAIKAGFGKVVFVIRRDIEEQFKQQIGSRYESMIEVDYAFQELNDLPAGFTAPAERSKPWGTGHAVYAARNVVKTPFAVLNADDFYGAYGFKAIANHFATNSNGCICSFVMSNTMSANGTVSRGVCSVDDNGNLESVVEHVKLSNYGKLVLSEMANGCHRIFTGNEPVSMNMWGFGLSFFNKLEQELVEFLKEQGTQLKSEFYIPFVVDNLIQRDGEKFKVLVSEDNWFGVTYREDRDHVVAGLAKLSEAGKYPVPLFAKI